MQLIRLQLRSGYGRFQSVCTIPTLRWSGPTLCDIKLHGMCGETLLVIVIIMSNLLA